MTEQEISVKLTETEQRAKSTRTASKSWNSSRRT